MERNKGVGGSRFEPIVDLMEEDSGTLENLVESDSRQISTVNRDTARNLMKDLEGHGVIPTKNNQQRSPMKTKQVGTSGTKNTHGRNMGPSGRPSNGPLKIVEQKNMRSPSKVFVSGKNKDKIVATGPLKESKSQNTLIRETQRDRGPTPRHIPAALSIKSGPYMQQKTVMSSSVRNYSV